MTSKNRQTINRLSIQAKSAIIKIAAKLSSVLNQFDNCLGYNIRSKIDCHKTTLLLSLKFICII